MRKVLFCVGITLLLLMTLFLVSVVPVIAFAETDASADTDYKQTAEYAFLSEFVTEHPIRSEEALLGSENAAAEYLKGKFQGLADEILGDDAADFCKLVSYLDNGRTITNVVATLSCQNSDKQVIIGAHYDGDGGQGANDNASGITALYFTMKTLLENRDDLTFNVVFVAFGAEELGMLGSQHYVSHMSNLQKDNTLAMFNFDVIANGDNLYVFCENKRTSLADFVLSNSHGSVKISEKPYAVGTYPIDVHGFGYYETIQNTDFTPFRLAGIPTVAYYSGNYRMWDYLESTDKSKNTMNTDDDTLQNLEKNGALFVKRIQSVVSSVTATVLNDGFVKVATTAREELVNGNVWFNMWWPRLVVIGIIAILVVIAVLYMRKLQKKAILGTAEIKNTRVFSSPDSEDIFTFQNGEKPTKSKQDEEIDDIFTFKE